MASLLKSDINKVKPKFRPMIEEAWSRGEEVPWSVILLDDRPLTVAEISHIRELNNQYHWE